MTASYQKTADLFKALAHPTRIQILDLLRGGEICVCHIEAAIGKRQAYISQQLMILREAELVDSRRDGLQVYYRLTDARVPGLLVDMLGTSSPVKPAPVENCPCPECSSVVMTPNQ